MAAPNKQRILSRLFTQLSKTYSEAVPENLSVMDHILLGLVQEGTSLTKGLETYRRLVGSFHDLNELRVSHPAEIADQLFDVPEPDVKARRILLLLQFVFETTYSFDLDSMRKKPLKQAHKQLSKITGVTDFAVSAAVQRALGGHAIPVDAEMHDLLVRMELLEAEETLEQAKAALEHLIPKAKGVSFSVLVGEMAADQERCMELLCSITSKAEKDLAPAAVKVTVAPAKTAAKSGRSKEAPKPDPKSKPKAKAAPDRKSATSKKSSDKK